MATYCKICGDKLIAKDLSQGEWPYYAEDTGEKLTYKETQLICPNFKQPFFIHYFMTEHHNDIPLIQRYRQSGEFYGEAIYHFKHF